MLLTLFWSLEADIEFLHVVVDKSDFIIAHQHLHDVRLNSALGTRHLGGMWASSRLELASGVCSIALSFRRVCQPGEFFTAVAGRIAMEP